MSRKLFKRFVILLSLASFFGSTAYGAVGSINSALNQPVKDTTTTSSPQESQMQAQARGYEMVLRREPENLVALKGLAEAHIQMKNPQSAIAPLQKLVKLHPSQQDYKMLLLQVKQQVGKGDH